MDPTLKFVIEAVCLTGIILLGAVATPALGKGRWDRTKWLQGAGLLVIGIGTLAVNPRGWPDLFPITIGFTVFCFLMTAVAVTLVQGWGFAHRGDGQVIEREAAINFSNMGLSGLFAAGFFLAAAVCTVWLAQAVADAWAYGHAPLCANASSGSCRWKRPTLRVSAFSSGSFLSSPHCSYSP